MKKEMELKLLRVIHTLVMSGTVTETARRLKQSPGNISYQLGKAREFTGKPLFTRTREGMKPEPAALQLSRHYLQLTNESHPTRAVKPHRERQNLKINTLSLVEMLFAVNVLGDNAYHPAWRFVFNSYITNAEERLRQLKNHTVDIDIGNKIPVDRSISAVKLFTSGASVLVGKHHRVHKTPFSIEEWENSPHVVWTAASDFYSRTIDGAAQIEQLVKSRKADVVSGSMGFVE
ncbi:MAG: LysR family transcriptional regulator [Scandinavium sp.]|uniref:LysR family transcriptional regulator n=1 Tax=Scandinavium sp. TaxID=2830653 RepID=UPI003F3295B8